MPAASPARTSAMYRSSNCSGCLASESARVLPASTSDLMFRISSCIFGFSWPRPTISKDCTSGTPEAIMVAIWRLKIAMSLASIFLPLRPPSSGFGFFLTLTELMPCRRSVAFTSASLVLDISPFTFWPFLSVPS